MFHRRQDRAQSLKTLTVRKITPRVLMEGFCGSGCRILCGMKSGLFDSFKRVHVIRSEDPNRPMPQEPRVQLKRRGVKLSLVKLGGARDMRLYVRP